MRVGDPPDPAHEFDFVLAEKPFDTAGEAFDDGVLALHHCGDVELVASDIHAEFGTALNVVQHRHIGEQHLGGNAPDVEARATDIALFHDHRARAKLRGADCRDVAARSGTDYNDVDIELGRPEQLFLYSRMNESRRVGRVQRPHRAQHAGRYAEVAHHRAAAPRG